MTLVVRERRCYTFKFGLKDCAISSSSAISHLGLALEIKLKYLTDKKFFFGVSNRVLMQEVVNVTLVLSVSVCVCVCVCVCGFPCAHPSSRPVCCVCVM